MEAKKNVAASVSDGREVLIAVHSAGGEGQISGGAFSRQAVEEAIADIESACKVMVEKLRSVGPKEFTLEFNVGFAVKSGKLLALLFEPEASAGMKVSMKWG